MTVAVFATFFYAGDEANLIPVVLGVILISFLVVSVLAFSVCCGVCASLSPLVWLGVGVSFLKFCVCFWVRGVRK